MSQAGGAFIIQQVQYLVAPAVMVSSAGLLLLGLQSKLSNLANRFRALQHEKRLLSTSSARDAVQEARLRNIDSQIAHLMRRARHTTRAIILTYAAIICFAGTSVLLFGSVHAAAWLGPAAVAVLIAGLACILGVSVLMIRETQVFYQILALEHAGAEGEAAPASGDAAES